MTRPVRVEDGEAQRLLQETHANAGGVRRQVNEMRAALTMLTRLRLPDSSDARTGARAFPLVGAVVGLAGLVPLVVLGSVIPIGSATLAVAAMAIVSGGLHLDGLADTADALVAVGPNGAERARKDPALGAAGATALILVLALEVAALADLVTSQSGLVAGLCCVVAGASSRLMPPVLAMLGRSHVVAEGLGAWFVARTTNRDVAMAVAASLAVLLVSANATGETWLLVAGVVGGIGAMGAGLGLVRLRRQIDGDLLGASVEVGFTLTVLLGAIMARTAGL